MATTITVTQQNFEITEVTDVIVTDIVQDPDVGDYVRDIRIFGVPAAAPDVSVLFMQIKIRSLSSAALEITAPTQQF